MAIACALALIGGWPITVIILVVAVSRSRDYKATLREDDAAAGPRPGRCVTHVGIWVDVPPETAHRLARAALDQFEPSWAGREAKGSRVAARIRRSRGAHPAQLVNLWIAPGGSGTDIVVEVRPRLSAVLFDRGASRTTAGALAGEIAWLTSERQVASMPAPPEPEPVVEKVGWRWWHVAIAIALFRLAGYPFLWIDRALGRPLVRGGYLVVGQLIVWGAVVGWLWIVSVRRGHGSFAEDYGFGFRWREDLAIGVPLGIGILIVQSVVVVTLSLLFGVHAASTATPLVDARRGHWLTLWPILIYAVVGAPLVEETVFRGLTLRGLERRLRVPMAVVVSGALFGALHWITSASVIANVVLVVSLGVSGMLLGMIAAATRRLGPSMIAHGTLNLIVSVVILVRYH